MTIKSFEFISQGMMRDKDIYRGNYDFKNDTLILNIMIQFQKQDQKALIEKDFINYINGNYSESLKVRLNKLDLKK
jgi:hypothetical protein